MLPLLLLLPQLAITAVFFLLPAGEAVLSSLTRSDPFGLRSRFVGLDNFRDLFADPLYLDAVARTAAFCAAVATLSLATGMALALAADRVLRGRGAYRALLTWPYAIAPAVAGVLWTILVDPRIGMVGRWLNQRGVAWDYRLNGDQAMLVVILASAWKQASYNFLFLLAGLQAVPRAVVEAARLDGAGRVVLFRRITLPLLAPNLSFLLTANLIYAAFDSFGAIQALTGGGPGQATETLMVRAYRDGVVNLEIGSAAAQSVLLMGVVIAATMLQYAALGRRLRA